MKYYSREFTLTTFSRGQTTVRNVSPEHLKRVLSSRKTFADMGWEESVDIKTENVDTLYDGVVKYVIGASVVSHDPQGQVTSRKYNLL
jgi:hypothetical protein